MDTTDDKDEPIWARRFLEALPTAKGVAAAARAAGISPARLYHRRKSVPAFGAAWDAIQPVDGRRARHSGPRKPRGAAKVERFLIELAETSNVSAAAAIADLPVSKVYKLRRIDPEFARRWYAALAEGYDNLEMELLGHLRAGEGGESASPQGKGAKKYDTAAALRCLAAHRESVAREKGRRALAEEVTTIASINEKIDRLRLNAEAGAKAIAKARREKARRSSSRSIGEAGTSAAAGPQKPRARKGSGDA